ncbi:non-ribosomal peptide synthetase/type I polyketide synthase [Streptomyces purpurogeneiscleroticus]|uniref:non-ribosomal peptide synthetase/type I polyketide synthase n=1 Tax=Streptomyces purpurogeneiscleroticus TaxID=68259 RepID=UPI001CBF0537|nr:non-ribosomal peptide synthetase/type I polyketide synthase [Streptomyces purpurogeneiscleroticus]MBZ4018994.1 non-ribosomal peptide synthetase [Streptomyces purpurogeneiscleroticus]
MSRVPDSALNDRIAIIGIGCRLPGHANDHRAFWRNLAEGRDCIVPTPADRYDVTTLGTRDRAKPGRLVGGRGGYIDSFDAFDPAFFGISPREATHLDPQQRKLLEVSWEALEDGGQRPAGLAGRDIGVFIGAFTMDYNILHYADLDFLTAHTATGTMMTMVSNRISHAFDFRGPSVSLDTACSSSLVALHLARQSLLRGETDLALAGGTLLHCAPHFTIAESKGGFLSVDGRSRAFDAAADGYVRAEGVAVVALKRLADAVRDGDPVHAVVLGSGVNQDGRTNGITVPREDAQVDLVRKVCAEAGVVPGSLQYIEAHGTSTPVGDPIEARALGRVLSDGRPPGAPCYVGSVKTNIGHTEAAAGIAGLLKTVLALKHRKIPPHLNLERLNPALESAALPFEIPDRLVDWPAHDGPARAGVNSFGFGGTNAHVLLEEAPAPAAASRPGPPQRSRTILPLSARHPEGLRALATGLRAELSGAHGTPPALADLGHTLAHRREHHAHRLAVVYSPAAPDSLDEALAAYERGEQHPRVVTGHSRERQHPGATWVFTGMGPQWWGMGRGLLATEPVYRAAVEACDREIRAQAGWSLLDELAKDEAESRMGETWLAQPANFALQTGLAALWRSHGLRPDAVVGHSTGEVAACYEAGVHTLPEAVTVILHRSRLQHRLAGTGTMLAVGLTEAEAGRRVRALRDRVSVAAVNSPHGVTLSGDADALRALASDLEEEGIFARFLAVDIPYHSVRMDPIRDELLAALADLKPRPPEVPLYLTARQDPTPGDAPDAAYWWENVREPVRFRAAVDRLAEDGHRLFLELGPHPVLGHSIAECLEATGTEGRTLASMHRREDEAERFHRTLAELHTLGVELDWDGLQPGGRVVPLPRYPWRQERYWSEPEGIAQVRLGRLDHPLLGRRTAHTRPTWEARLDTEQLPYLADHRIQGNVVFPAAGYLEMVAQAVRALTGGGPAALADIRLTKALFLDDAQPTAVQFSFDPDGADFTVATGAAEPAVHATGVVRAGQRRAPGPALDPDAVRSRAGHRLSGPETYAALAGQGYEYGPAFQGIEEVWTGPGEALARIRPPAGLTGAADSHCHPALLDAAFQTLLTTLLAEDGRASGGIRLPLAIGEVRLDPVGDRPFWVHATLTRQDADEITGDLALYAEDGTPLGRITGFRAADVERAAASVGLSTIDNWLAEVVWTDADADALPEDADRPGDLLILADAGPLAEQLAGLARDSGGRCHLVRPGTRYTHGPEVSTVRPDSAEDLTRLFADLDAPFDAVVHLWNLDLPALDEVTRTELTRCTGLGAYSLVRLAQLLPDAQPGARLHIVTRGTQPVDADDPVEPLGAAAWGLGRVLWQQELTAQRGKLIDLPAEPAEGEAEALWRELATTGDEEIALRGGERRTSRLRPPTGLTRPLPLRLRRDGDYLVTGAFGALGQVLCRTLVERGARRLILVGRTPVPDRTEWHRTDPGTPTGQRIAFLKELEALGAQPVPAPLDITDEAALTDWLADRRSRQLPPIRGVFHLAGEVRDALVPEMDRAAFDAAYAPKVAGGWLLHHHLRDEPLDHFVLFGSIAALMTTAGQTNYAAGNAFLDALAHHRRARGLPALSLGWGPWDAGMIEERGLAEHYRTARGMSPLSPAAGMAVLQRTIGQEWAQLAVAPVTDWRTATAWYTAPPPLVADLAAAAADTPATEARGTFLETFHATEGEEARRHLTMERFGELVAAVLGVPCESVDPAAGLLALGLDSLLAMELRARVGTELGVTLPVVALLSGEPVDALTTRLYEGLLAAGGPEATPAAEQHIDEERYPLTYNQKALWFLRELDPDAHAYNIGGATLVHSELDPDLFVTAFRLLVERHPCLRTTFVAEEGRPVQRVSPEARVDVAVFDVQGEDWDAVRERMIQEYRRPYDLTRGPLVRLRLYKLAPGRWVTLNGVHHIISDAHSVFTFVEEVFALYDALRHGRPTELPPLPARYLDFLNQQNSLLAGPEAQRMLDYWRAHLPARIPYLELPTDKPRPVVATHRGASEFFEIDAALGARVHALSLHHGVTPFMVLLSAYYLLLHRYSGQDDLIIGSPVSGRTRPEFAPVYGYFVNPLPLHVSLAGDPSVADLLARTRDTVLGGLDNQEYPFVLLVEQLGLPHDASRSAVFQSMFALLTHQLGEELSGYRAENIQLPEQEGQFDLTLVACEEPADGRFTCALKYNTDLFHAATARRMAGHYLNLLDALTRAPAEAPAARLPLLGPEERDRILVRWSGTGRTADHDVPVPDLIRRRAAERPGAVAVVAPAAAGETHRLTYAELDERSRRAARRLRALGVRDGAVVAVRMAKSPELIVTLLAVLRAGGCYLPLDPGHPADRTARLVADAGAVLLVADRAEPRRDGCEVVTPDDLDAPEPEDSGTSEDTEPPIALDAPAYILHTSGSTGRPKAVRVSHRNLAAVHAAWRAEYGLDDEAGVHLQMAAPSFDVFTGDLVRALCSGGTLLLADRDLLFDTHRLYRTMAEERVDCAEFVPAVARGLISHCETAGLRLDFLRLLIVGSDTWRAGEHRRLHALCGPRTRLVNSYGLTEATIDSAYFEGPVDGLAPGATVPIGRPLPNSELYILDRYGEPVPPGVTGELFIGGAAVATGYLGDPEENARRFPTRTLDGAPRRLCRTGDLARWSADGTVQLLGRADRQVKVRGHRVETGEVETQLSRCAALRQVHVTTRRTDGGDNALCAYYVPDEGTRVDRGELRRRLADHLPAYMIPSHFVALPALPLTANGKVDTAALPAPAYEPEDRTPEAPATPYEARMAAHWQALLGGELLGPGHEFFEAGGSSLTLIELIHHLRTEYGTEIPVGPLFKDTTLRGMARTVEQVVAGDAGEAPPCIRFGPEDPAPDRTVFCFPPAGGHGAAYRELAGHLPDFHVIAFDYLPSLPDEDKAARYADLITSLRPDGPCALLGYSLGGNLAFEVAKELERRGREVSRLVLLDSYRFTEAGPLGAEQLARFEEGLRDRLGERAGTGPLAEETIGQARDYLAYCCRTPNLGTVAAPITVIAAERSGLSYVFGKRAGWQESSRTGAVRLDGSGTHDELLDPAHLGHNARLAREALAGAECGVPA